MHFVWATGAWQYQRDFELHPVSDARSWHEGLWMWLYHSQHGVYLFFVLSGYLLSKRWLIAQNAQLRPYLTDRALRTLPGVWLALLAALAMLYLDHHLPEHPVLRWLENAFFLNWFRGDDLHHLLIVTWSLQAEWLFYLSLPIVAWLARTLGNTPQQRLFAVLAYGILVMVLLKATSVRGAAYALFFTTGAACALKQNDWRTVVQKTPWWLVIGMYAGVNFVYAWTTATAARLQAGGFGPFEWHAIAFAIVSGMLLLKSAEHVFGDTLLVRTGRYIGRISYSIYLWHLLILIAFGQFLGLPARLEALPTPVAIAIYLSALIAATWLISVASFYLVEKPYFSRRRADKQ
jgi:exopolysaccharide production protein ExoZ